MAVEVDMVGCVLGGEIVPLKRRGWANPTQKGGRESSWEGFEYQGTVLRELCPYQAPEEKWLGWLVSFPAGVTVVFVCSSCRMHICLCDCV